MATKNKKFPVWAIIAIILVGLAIPVIIFWKPIKAFVTELFKKKVPAEQGENGSASDAVNPSGTTRGLRNNNPGNIKFTSEKWQGKVYDNKNDDVFEEFISMDYGIRAALINLRTYLRQGIDTIPEIISTWAPAFENDTANYIGMVVNHTGINPDKTISWNDKDDIMKIAQAIFKMETEKLFTMAEIKKGYDLI